jgi:hypothetical protein
MCTETLRDQHDWCSKHPQRCQRGQALLELLVAMLAIVPVFFGVAWLARMQDMQQATIAAARALAFECTVRPQACSAAAHATSESGGSAQHRPSAQSEKFAEELRKRLFAAPRSSLRSDDNATGEVSSANGNALWVDRTGKPLLERFEDVSIEIAPVRFNSPFAFAGGQGDRSFPGAVRLLSELGGPGRFGLGLEAGFIDARVQVDVARSRPSDGWLRRMTAMPITLKARLSILTDSWTASGPYGSAPDSVQTRVDAGARLPGIEPALRAAWLPVRGLLATGALLGFESRASEFKPYQIDVDLVPPDRLGLSAGGAVSTDPNADPLTPSLPAELPSAGANAP